MATVQDVNNDQQHDQQHAHLKAIFLEELVGIPGFSFVLFDRVQS